MHHIDRRTALAHLARTPLVLGLPGALAALLGQDPHRDTARPPWLDEALRRAAATRTPLLAVVLPDRLAPEQPDPARAADRAVFEQRLRLLLERRPERELRPAEGAEPMGKSGMACWMLRFEDPQSRFLLDLQLLLESPRYELRELFVEATWVCVRRAQVGAAEGETVVELDAQGRRLSGMMVDLADEDAFARATGHLLHDGRRARERADRALTPEVRAALEDLGGRDEARRRAASELLRRRFATHRAALLRARRETRSAALARALRDLVEAEHRRATAAGLSGPLPFGVELQEHHVYDPCPPCGMARVPAASRKLLSFLACRQGR